MGRLECGLWAFGVNHLANVTVNAGRLTFGLRKNAILIEKSRPILTFVLHCLYVAFYEFSNVTLPSGIPLHFGTVN